MFPSDHDVADLVAWRHHLHTMPDVSREEAATAAEVQRFLAPTGPDEVIAGLGGHGLALVYRGTAPGPTVMFRAELDALPITDLSEAPYRSHVAGQGHLCGHDGHMATLAVLARALGARRPARGRAVLLFQPAEEDGSGAAAVLADPRFAAIAPDLSFSYHNLPGVPLGQALLREGPVNCASRGLRIVLTGKTAHASQPETGLSPMAAMARLMPALTALGHGTIADADYTLVTITHAALGTPAFGIAPGYGEIWATLRTLTDAGMARLCATAEAMVQAAAEAAGLGVSLSYEDVFAHCENAPAAVAHLRKALIAEGVPVSPDGLPMRASEDFGRFGQAAPAAMMFLGAGETHPALHNPDYDFPDVLIAIGGRVMLRLARDLLG